MQISDLPKPVGQLTETLIRRHLLQGCLRQSFLVGVVSRIRAIQNSLLVPVGANSFDNFVNHPRTRISQRVMRECQIVAPSFVVSGSYGGLDVDYRVLSRIKRTNFSHAATDLNRLGQSAAFQDQIPQKTHCIKEIGFPGGIRSHEKDAVGKRHIHRRQNSSSSSVPISRNALHSFDLLQFFSVFLP